MPYIVEEFISHFNSFDSKVVIENITNITLILRPPIRFTKTFTAVEALGFRRPAQLLQRWALG